MKSISARIKSKRKALGYSQASLGAVVGVKAQAVSAWEREVAKPLGDKLNKLSKALGVSTDWLLNGEEQDVLLKSDANHNCCDSELVPIFSNIDASAGHGFENYDEYSCIFFPVPTEIMNSQHNRANIFCIKAKGNSMEPVIRNGAVLAINPARKEVVDGRVYVINDRGGLRVKVLKQTVKGLVIESFNSEYDAEFIEWDEIEDLEIVGEVFWYSSYLY